MLLLLRIMRLVMAMMIMMMIQVQHYHYCALKCAVAVHQSLSMYRKTEEEGYMCCCTL